MSDEQHEPSCAGCQIVGLIDRADKAEAEIRRLRRVCRQWASDYCDVEEQRDAARVAVEQARRWIETCVDPVAVGPMRKQAMLDYLDGKRDVPDFERIPGANLGGADHG